MILKDGFSRFAMAVLTIGVAVAGLTCAAAAQESAGQQAPAAPAAGVQEFEGTVKVGLGKYFYLPTAQGFDIVAQGTIEGQDASFLVGKEIRVKGTMLSGEPSVLVADSIELKEGGQYRSVFTRTEETKLEDHLHSAERGAFEVLKITSANKSEEWEGKEKAKIFGKLSRTGAGDKETYTIVISDEKGKEVGTILVDSVTQFANYYIKKLRLFDSFWFYLNIKETVDAKVRRKTRELFHADMIFAGLY